MLQALKPQFLIHVWSWEDSIFSLAPGPAPEVVMKRDFTSSFAVPSNTYKNLSDRTEVHFVKYATSYLLGKVNLTSFSPRKKQT